MQKSNDPDYSKQLQLIYSAVVIIKDILFCLAMFGKEPMDSSLRNSELIIPETVYLDDFSPNPIKS